MISAVRNRRAAGAVALLLGSFALGFVVPAWGQDAPKPPETPPGPAPEGIAITAERMSIKAYIQLLSERGGLTILDEAGVDGEITLTAQKKISIEDAINLLTAWLTPKQRTTVRQGNVLRIMTLEDAKKRGSLPVKVGADPKDVPDNDTIVTQVVSLRRIKADDVAGKLRGLLSSDGQIYVEPSTNSVVITETQSVIRRLLLVVYPLDRSPSLEVTPKVYQLKNAAAEEVAAALKELFPKRPAPGQQGQGGRGGQGGFGGMLGQILGGPGGGGGGPGGGGRGGGGGGGQGGGQGNQAQQQEADVQVAVDKRSNSVIVAATEAQHELIKKLVEEIDKAPIPVITDLKTFRLTNASPADLAVILQAIFTQQAQQAQGGGGGGGGGGQGVPPWMRAAFQGQQTSANDSSYYQVQPKFTVDARTNSLIVAATPTQMQLIGALVKDLDQDSTYRQSVLVVPLKNADATNVAKVLTDLLNAANTSANRGPAGNAQGSTTTALAELTGDVKVVADADSNALVLTTSPKNFPRLRTVIADLDRLRRQVQLECLLAQVTLDSKGELGVQWSANFTRDMTGRVGGTQNIASNLGLGAITQGFNYTSTSDKVSMLIHALQTDGRLNVLSSPKILGMENQVAEINVGQQVPYVTNSRVTQNGDTVNTIQYQNVGIILKVTPHINDAGEVRMVVHPEVSQIGPQSEAVQITANVTSPVFEKNYADTTVIVRDGDTAIIGGLIRDDVTETVNKLPILGDIPLLGLAFRDKQYEKKKVELVVFLTPHVVDDAEQLRRRTNETSSKFVLVPPEVMKDELDRWTRGLDEGSAVAHYNRGTVYYESGRILEAIDELATARDLAPKDAATHFNLGLAYAKKGDLDRAEAELKAASRLEPRDAECHYNLGAVMWRRQDYQGAATEFRAALSLEPLHEEARRWVKRADEAARDAPEPPARGPDAGAPPPKAPDAQAPAAGGNQ